MKEKNIYCKEYNIYYRKIIILFISTHKYTWKMILNTNLMKIYMKMY